MTRKVNRTPTLEEAIKTSVEYMIGQARVSLPAKIESYDPTEQTCEARPMLISNVLDPDGEEIAEELPVLADVPVMFPRANNYFISFPVKPGDLVLLVFMDRSIDKFLGGNPVTTATPPINPGTYESHDLSSAVAIPGFYPYSMALKNADADNLVIGDDVGSTIRVRSDGEIHLIKDNPSEFIALATKTINELTSIITGFNSHTHSGVTPGPPTLFSGPAVPQILPPGSVASAKVKAD